MAGPIYSGGRFSPSFGPVIDVTGGSRLDAYSYSFSDAGAIPPFATFSRASTGVDFGATGTMQTYAIDTPRFGYKYNSSAGVWVPRGILIEPSRTNLVKYTTITGSNWLFPAPYIQGHTTDPFGGNTAVIVNENTSTAAHIFYPNTSSYITMTSGVTYTMSCFAKYNSSARYIQIIGRSSGFGLNMYANFDLLSGAFGTVGSGVESYCVEKYGDWYRIQITVTAQTTASGTPIIICFLESATDARSPSYTGTGVNAIFWGAQTEVGSGASSFIYTSESSVTRASDSLTITIPNGVSALQYTFDDDTTQVVTGLSAGSYTIPTTLNRPWIKTISAYDGADLITSTGESLVDSAGLTIEVVS